jgi:hypothetical protein
MKESVNSFILFMIGLFLCFFVYILKSKNILNIRTGVWSEYKDKENFYIDDTSKLFYCNFNSFGGNELIEINEKTISLTFKENCSQNYEIYVIRKDNDKYKMIKSYIKPRKLFFNDKILDKEKKYLILLRVNDYDLYPKIPEYKILKDDIEEKNIKEDSFLLNELDGNIKDKFESLCKKTFDNTEFKVKKIVTSEKYNLFPFSKDTAIRKVNVKVKKNDKIVIFSRNRNEVNENIKQSITVSTYIPSQGYNNYFFEEKNEKETISLEIPDLEYFFITLINDYDDSNEEDYEIIEKIYNISDENLLIPFKVFVLSQYKSQIKQDDEYEDEEYEEEE